ncbi:hypothetical protein ElyMa_000536900 [Elysia marginata]|uniref:Activin types I and II receptor domain-containing protein n=1 Tax=Elysia marginata TaxID=1093978 RepID=A0AAV4G074_9GAST|nr:hypothetical protein ElyMa_000536900 [Elysia marginata]
MDRKNVNKVRSVLFFFIVNSLPIDGALFCYHGNDINTLDALVNETCLTNQLHTLKPSMSDEQQTAMPPFEETEADPNTQTLVSPHCYIFRHITTTIYASGTRQESVSISLGCDRGRACDNKSLNKILYNATRQNSQLYCCSSDNCNFVDRIPDIATDLAHIAPRHPEIVAQFCYHGTNNVSGTPTAEIRPCSQSDVACARRTTFLPQGKIKDYFCDNGRSCSEHQSSGAYHSCSNKTVDNITQELCCCNENKCFMPHWHGLTADDVNNTISPERDPSLKPMGSTINKPGKKSKSSALITGLVAGIVLVAGLAAGIIFVRACKRRKSQCRDPNVIMQYERLSVSDAEMEDAVVL